MSVAGILASNLFSEAGSQLGQMSSSAANFASGAQSAFAALQQKLSQSTSGAGAGTVSIPSQLTQLGQDLKSGNLSAAQSDFSAFKMTLAQAQTHLMRHFQAGPGSSGGSTSATGSAGTASQSGSDPLAAAMLAYSSLQQSPAGSGLGASLMPPASTFAVDA